MDGQNEQAAQASGEESHLHPAEAAAPETKRHRVRRLLLDRLGFRFHKAVAEADGRKVLDGLADELGYMADASLSAMAEMLQSHGQGAARNIWPDRATVIGLAEVVERRPLEQLPALLRWFGSVEGPRAAAEGTLVETWEYIRTRKTPPVTPQAQKLVAERAHESNRRIAIIGERRAAGVGITPDDLAWERWYLERRAACEVIVARERAARARGAEGAA